MSYQDRRRMIALSQAGSFLPGSHPRLMDRSRGTQVLLHLLAKALRSLHPASQILAEVRHGGWARRQREHSVKAGHAVGIGGGHIQSLADVIQRSFAHPAE